jgi:transcriptional regulator with XRE-family HTH domain
VRKKTADEERRILLEVLKGASYGEVALRNGVSKSTVNRIIEDVRRGLPDFDALRELNIRLKRDGRSVLDVLSVLEDMENNVPMFRTIYVTEKPQEKNEAVRYLEWALANRVIWIACKNCWNMYLVPLAEAGCYREAIGAGASLAYVCPHCAVQSLYSPYDVLGFFALSLLEKDEIVFRLDFSADTW